MAKQNIISGGFYGKVGELIGQRWKNIRTVRAYTKPRNPRTEKQQANRSSFGSLVPRAQLAMQLNYHAGYFTSESNSEWGMRMSLASSLLKAGYELLNLLPIIPLNYSPSYVISEITAIDTTNKRKPIFYVNGNLPTVNRSLSVVVSLYNETTEKYEDFVFSTTLVNGASHYFELEFTFDVEINKLSRFIIVSNNDAEEPVSGELTNTTIASKMLAYSPIEPIVMEILNYEETNLANPYITFNASVDSLAKLGITDTQTLLQVWATAGTSHANCKYGIYDAEKQVPTVLSANTTINALEYVSDTQIKVTLVIDTTLAKTQAFEEITSIAENALFIKPIDNSKPVLYVPTITDAALPHETFVQPSASILSQFSFEQTKLQSQNIVFESDIDDLSQYGITDNKTLVEAWNVSESTSANGTFGIYDADSQSLISRSANVKISSLDYVSNTKIKVTLQVTTLITDLEALAEITDIAAGALKIEASRIIYPNLEIGAMANISLNHETFIQPSEIKTSGNNYNTTALQSTRIIFLATVRSLSQYGITSQATLNNAWSVAKATSAGGSFKIYEAGAAADKTVSATTTLVNLEYVSDTSVRVTLNVATSVNDIQAISGIVSLADNAISIVANSVRYPDFGISAISNVALNHETFIKPSEVVTSNHKYDVTHLGNSSISFTATVASLSKYGVTSSATLKNLWNPAYTTEPNGTFSVYDEETEESDAVTHTVTIEDLAYISDTQIKVYLSVDVELTETQAINTIISIANKALAIANSNIRYPNFAIMGMTDIELDYE